MVEVPMTMRVDGVRTVVMVVPLRGKQGQYFVQVGRNEGGELPGTVVMGRAVVRTGAVVGEGVVCAVAVVVGAVLLVFVA